jgi:DNA-binding response OmpR family regulator
MHGKTKILVVEDDNSLGLTLKERLEKEGYSTELANSIYAAKKLYSSFSPDLLVLDVKLPDGSGFDFAESIQKEKLHPPFLFLTAVAGAPERLRGFELGAEEFIPKPFHLKEFLLRINHVLKDHKLLSKPKSNKFSFDGHIINIDAFEILTPSKEKIPLQSRDCALLTLLITEKHRAISRDEILDKIWGEEKFPTNRTVDNSIVRLRQALGKNGHDAIDTVRSVGYRWVGELN